MGFTARKSVSTSRLIITEKKKAIDKEKIIDDLILATQDTVFVLQTWLGLLEMWQSVGRAEPDDFMDACQQLREVGLENWVNEAGGQELAVLAEAVALPMDSGLLGMWENLK